MHGAKRCSIGGRSLLLLRGGEKRALQHEENIQKGEKIENKRKSKKKQKTPWGVHRKSKRKRSLRRKLATEGKKNGADYLGILTMGVDPLRFEKGLTNKVTSSVAKT